MTIDLRSDTVTRPTSAMREAMARAEVGDDVFGDDPTVNRLERRVAELLGKEAAMFAPSGTQSNLLGIMAHCGRGDEYIVGLGAHTFRNEAGGAAVLASVQPQTVANESDGTMDLAAVEAEIKPDDSHFARTRLLCLENSYNGRVVPLDYQKAFVALAERYGLGTHLDGARLCNAAVALGVPPIEVAAPFDTVSLCLSKGLGAPVGSVLAGPVDLISSARRQRKMLGGGMRQVGLLAAAALVAIDDHIDRLADDHRRARRLAEGLDTLDGFDVDLESVETNMVFVDFDAGHAPPMNDFMAERDITVLARPSRARLVVHLDVDDDDIATVLAAFEAYSRAR